MSITRDIFHPVPGGQVGEDYDVEHAVVSQVWKIYLDGGGKDTDANMTAIVDDTLQLLNADGLSPGKVVEEMTRRFHAKTRKS